MAGPRRARFLTLGLLSAGDILDSLLSVVALRFYFKNFFGLSPQFYVVWLYFGNVLMPFVYGVAIICLAVEGTIFGRKAVETGAATQPGAFVTLAISFTPWILGLLVLTPLRFSPAVSYQVQGTPFICLAYLLPAALALGSAVFMFLKKPETSAASPGNQQHQTVALSTVSAHSNPTMYPTLAPSQPSGNQSQHARVVHDIVTDAAHDGPPELAKPSGSGDDEIGLLFPGNVNDFLPWLATRGAEFPGNLKRKLYYKSVCV
ncbi:hypothetical protein ElyMa_002214800 [Elysia marginata]|uniref:Uncharacterized protein n=1 Tax=Elysia marginata TaxID=1093978 RepID=A0AAV4FUY1_9GAST|nr:hypothetical protein ElyMa_002214800 [Elysia marginata]